MSQTYKLRSGKSRHTRGISTLLDENNSSLELRQSTIQFRKRRHPPAAAIEDKLEAATENIADHFSPPKRHKPSGMSGDEVLFIPFPGKIYIISTSHIVSRLTLVKLVF